MSDETPPQENNEQTTQPTPVDIQKNISDTHQSATAHFDNFNSENHQFDTLSQMRQHAEKAKEISENLHTTIEQSTLTGDVADVMKQDGQNAAIATNKLTKTDDPLKAYEGYSAYAVPQTDADDENRNYYDNPLTYDEFTVDGKKVDYNLTEVIPGGVAHATNNPNHIIGTNIHEQSFSYNEKTSGGKTIVTTEETTKGTRTAGSEHVHIGQDFTSDYENKRTHRNTYDSNDKLIESEYHSSSNHVLKDSRLTAHKGQDISGNNGNLKTITDITAQNNDTRFCYQEVNKDQTIKTELRGERIHGRESYSFQEGGNFLDTKYGPNNQGEMIYSGHKGKIQGTEIITLEELSEKEAEKEFNRLKKEVNKKTKDLTGQENLTDYEAQLGTPKLQHNLGTIFDNNSTPEDAAKAQKANEETTQQFAATPAAIVAIKNKTR